MKIFIVTFFLLVSNNIKANDVIQSVYSILHEKGSMYIDTDIRYGKDGYLSSKYRYLETLWKSKTEILFRDDSMQEWKQISLEALQLNTNPALNHYIVINGKQISSAKIESTALFKYGCDESITPVFNIGPSPYDMNNTLDSSGLAIKLPQKYGLPTLLPLDKAFLNVLPASNKKNILSDRPLMELRWKTLPDLTVALAEYTLYMGTRQMLIIFSKITKTVTFIEAIPVVGIC